MIGAVVSFTAMLALVKIVRLEMSTLDTMVWRSLSALPLSVLVARQTGLRIRNVRIMVLRTVIGFISMIAFFNAIPDLSLTELSLITRLQPIEVALMAPLFLGRSESSGRWIWGALALAFLGSVLLVVPLDALRSLAPTATRSPALMTSILSTAALWALLASVSSAGAHLCVRALTQTDSIPAVVFWFQLGSTLLAILDKAVTMGAAPAIPPSHLWWPLVGIGVTATLGQVLMTRAYATEQASIIAGATYSEPLVTLIADVSIFATFPPVQSFAGGALIVAAGLPLLLRRPALSEPPSAIPSSPS